MVGKGVSLYVLNSGVFQDGTYWVYSSQESCLFGTKTKILSKSYLVLVNSQRTIKQVCSFSIKKSYFEKSIHV